MILLDTNILSELMRPEPNSNVVAWIDPFQRTEIGISSITVAEILYGIGAIPEGKRKQLLLKAAGLMFEEEFYGQIYAFDENAAVEYADIVLQREKKGRPISIPDAQIAAICRSERCELATRNTKDFEGTGVILINPFE